MFSKTLRRFILVPLLFASPLMGQTRMIPKEITVNPVIKFRWVELMEDYQTRYLAGRLTWREFEYAKKFVCPVLPPPPGQPMHLCNSSVVGTSDQDPEDFVIYNPGLIKAPICWTCILTQP